MFQNYLKIAFRNFFKYKANSAINVFGLVLGLTTSIIIGLYLKYELSYDNMHKDIDRVYRVNTISSLGQNVRHNYYTAPQLAPAIREDIPEVELSTGLRVLYNNKPLKWKEKTFFEYKMSGVDRAFWNIIGLNVVKGDLSLFDKDLNNVFMSEGMATRVFGKENPIGEVISIAPNEEENRQFKVVGIFEDIPTNSHLYEDALRFDLLTSTETLNVLNGQANWRSTMGPTYIKVKEAVNEDVLNDKINSMLRARAGEDIWYEHYVQPIRDIHLNSRGFEISSDGDQGQLYTFSIIGVLLLVIACINYINLTTAQASVRLKEVGIRKVIGAKKKQFIAQFLVEATLMSVFSALISIVLVLLVLPVMNSTFGLSLDISITNDLPTIFGFLLVMLFVSLLCGTYPGFYLSRLDANSLLKSSSAMKSGGGLFRKILVTLQYVTSITLIITTLIILNQLEFMNQRDLGFKKEAVVYLNVGARPSAKYGETLLTEITRLPGVVAASLSGNSPGDGNMSGNGVLVGNMSEDDFQMHQVLAVDVGLKEVLQIEMLEGRWFSEDFGSDRQEGFVVNEAFVKHFSLAEPIGVNLNRNSQKGKIVGVTKDFHYKSMRHSIEPLVLYMAPRNNFGYWKMAIRLSPNNGSSTMTEIEEVWKSVVPELPFNATFLDEKIETFYKQDKDFAVLFSTFSGLAILVSCLGLIGLVAFTTQRRSKEIGVRKVLGASIGRILGLISRDFILMILLGALIAVPVAYIFGKKWLEGFEYRIEISYWTFVIALIITLVISWISVSYVSLRAARANPVDSLRSE